MLTFKEKTQKKVIYMDVYDFQEYHIPPLLSKKVNAEEKFHVDKKVRTFSSAHIDHPGGKVGLILTSCRG